MRGEERRYDLLASPLDKVALIPVENIERPGFPPGQFLCETPEIRLQELKPLFNLDIDFLSQLIGDLADGRILSPLLDYHVG